AISIFGICGLNSLFRNLLFKFDYFTHENERNFIKFFLKSIMQYKYCGYEHYILRYSLILLVNSNNKEDIDLSIFVVSHLLLNLELIFLIPIFISTFHEIVQVSKYGNLKMRNLMNLVKIHIHTYIQ